MSDTTALSLAPRFAASKTILIAGGVAGLLDILYAIGIWAARGVPPMRILQSVAGGILGRDAFTGGAPAALLGLIAHFFIMMGAAALFYYAATRLRLATQRPVLAGCIFGFGMYLAMTYVIVPLSAAPGGGGGGSFGWDTLIALLPHIVLVGIPMAYIIRHRQSGR